MDNAILQPAMLKTARNNCKEPHVTIYAKNAATEATESRSNKLFSVANQVPD